MTKQEAIKQFTENSTPFGDYWEMQLDWECYLDALRRDKEITEHQCNNWGNPCTPETFKKWQAKQNWSFE